MRTTIVKQVHVQTPSECKHYGHDWKLLGGKPAVIICGVCGKLKEKANER